MFTLANSDVFYMTHLCYYLFNETLVPHITSLVLQYYCLNVMFLNDRKNAKAKLHFVTVFIVIYVAFSTTS